MKGAPRSKQYNDVYFSVENGLAETQHVFIKGNYLPEAWAGRPQFTIVETGFGTGLNFLTTWKLFEETATDNQTLYFVSVEKFPLNAEEIRQYLHPWDDVFGSFLNEFVAAYPATPDVFHEIVLTDRVRLMLLIDDVNEALPALELHAPVDAWFLDGFKPSSNPDMWTDTVFHEMARLSRKGSTFATFTAAGFVKRGLGEAGFAVQKVPGYGRKREMLIGVKT